MVEGVGPPARACQTTGLGTRGQAKQHPVTVQLQELIEQPSQPLCFGPSGIKAGRVYLTHFVRRLHGLFEARRCRRLKGHLNGL